MIQRWCFYCCYWCCGHELHWNEEEGVEKSAKIHRRPWGGGGKGNGSSSKKQGDIVIGEMMKSKGHFDMEWFSQLVFTCISKTLPNKIILLRSEYPSNFLCRRRRQSYFCLNVTMSEEVDPQVRLHQILYKRRCAAWAFHFYSTRLGVGRKLVGQQKVFTLEDLFI